MSTKKNIKEISNLKLRALFYKIIKSAKIDDKRLYKTEFTLKSMSEFFREKITSYRCDLNKIDPVNNEKSCVLPSADISKGSKEMAEKLNNFFETEGIDLWLNYNTTSLEIFEKTSNGYDSYSFGSKSINVYHFFTDLILEKICKLYNYRELEAIDYELKGRKKSVKIKMKIDKISKDVEFLEIDSIEVKDLDDDSILTDAIYMSIATMLNVNELKMVKPSDNINLESECDHIEKMIQAEN